MTGRSPRFRVNPFRTAIPPSQAGTAAARRFHESLPGYAPTPLHRLDALARELGIGALHLKDESNRLGLPAFKGLGATWALHRLLLRGERLDTVATATDGNHGRAVAWAARRLGLRSRVYMTSHSAPDRIAAIRQEGADVILVDGTYDDAVRHCAERSAAEGWQVIADVGYPGYLEIPEWIAEGYETLFDEIDDQLAGTGEPAAHVMLLQAGVGGFAAAGVRSARRTGRPVRIGIVEPVDADPVLESALTADGMPASSTGEQRSIMACLNCGEVSLTAWPVLRAGADVFFSIEDHWTEQAMRQLAFPADGDPRIVAGESGAAGLAGLLALLRDPRLEGARAALDVGPETRVLLVNTEGATDPAAFLRIVGQEP